MRLLDEYRRSLKMPEAEELFDLYFYRPVAFAFVKLIYRLPITPNQVTLLALIAGLASAWHFAAATPHALIWAGTWYGVANILDCSDGQLARLQHSGTPHGRLIDGVVDYIVSIAIFTCIGSGMATTETAAWLLVIAAGLSSALHALLFDHYQNEFISIVRGERIFNDRELDKINAAGIRRTPASLVLNIYRQYLYLQSRFLSAPQNVDPGTYRSSHLGMIRLWSFLGPTTNRTALIVSAIAGRVDIFLWAVVIPGNIWTAFCLVRQRHISTLPPGGV